MKKILLLLLFAVSVISSAMANKLPIVKPAPNEKQLYKIFQNPDHRHRPYVRWWWNGSRVEAKEILRELDLMHSAGIGGVEINTIQFPAQTDSLGLPALTWLSDQWQQMVKIAADGCRERGMVCDIIVGSGWPFGGEFLRPDQQIQQLCPVAVDVKGGSFSISRAKILEMAQSPISHPREAIKELMYIRLMPKQISQFTAGQSFDSLVANDQIQINVPEGDHVLYFFVKRTGYMRVIVGAPGASGSVVNHLDAKAVRSYLNHFSDKMNFKSGPLKGLVRAAFCDSFELEGDNWTDDMPALFEKKMGYSLLPYLPYIILQTGTMGEPVRDPSGSRFSAELMESVVNRVRNDFWGFQTHLFQKNFIDVYNAWCHENGLLSRVQAYGRQLHPIESSMSLDLPECESWIHDGIGRVMNPGDYLSGRGYSQANKYVSSGAFLAGRKIVSCEEQTNVGNIFQTTLEEIKITGDRSNLSGVNQSVLHGYNYSPPQKDYIGWIQFGTYFHENNTWWPYLRKWMDYKSRVSALLQNSDYQADIALMQPLEDFWSIHGQQRDPYPGVTYPAYANQLWEALMQSGHGCDYVSDRVICQSSVSKGVMRFGSRSYKTIMLMDVESLSPAAALKLSQFVGSGGRVVCIGKQPHRSFGLHNAASRDKQVKAIVEPLASTHPQYFVSVEAPSGPILEWFTALQTRLDLSPYVRLSAPDRFLMVNTYKSGNKDIYFAVNSSIDREQKLTFTFPANVAAKQAWLWDAEGGERCKLAIKGSSIDLCFGPAESKIIVFDGDHVDGKSQAVQPAPAQAIALNGNWSVKSTHKVTGKTSKFTLTDLVDLHALPFPEMKNFAGDLEYSQSLNIEHPELYHTLDAGLTYNGLTEVSLNGESLGVKWYGNRRFDLSGKLRKGENVISIRVVTLLGNYVKSTVSTTPTAARWDWALRMNKEVGLCGPVSIY